MKKIVFSSDPKTTTKGVDMCHEAFKARGYALHLFDAVRLDTAYLTSVAQAIERRPCLSIWTNGVSCGVSHKRHGPRIVKPPKPQRKRGA